MDQKTAISRIFHIFAGVSPDLLGEGWDRGIMEEIAAIQADEPAALQDLRARRASCAAGYGASATGVSNWNNGLVVLLRILSRSNQPTVRAFLYEMTSFGGSAADWFMVQSEAQRLLQEGAAASWAEATMPLHASPPVSPVYTPVEAPQPAAPAYKPADAPQPAAPAYKPADAPQPAAPQPAAPVYYKPADAPQPAVSAYKPADAPQPAVSAYKPADAPQPAAPAYKSADVPQPAAPVYYKPADAPQPVSPEAASAAPPKRRPFLGLILPVALLFIIWIFALLNGPELGAYPNSLLCIYASAYCMLLGCALSLLQHKRYVFAAIVLIFGALFSALTLGFAKMPSSYGTPSFALIMSYTQFWLDLAVLLAVAALVVLCGLLLPRIRLANIGHYVAPIGGLVVLIYAVIAMLVSLPVVSFLPVLFAIFTSILLGALTTFTAILIKKAATLPKFRLQLKGGAIAWFSICIALSLGAIIWVSMAEEAYAPLFMLCMGFVQIAMLITLLCKRPGGYLWYVVASLTIFMCGLTNFLFAYVVSTSWLPHVLFAGLLNAVGPAVGWLFVRKQFRAAQGGAVQSVLAGAAVSAGVSGIAGTSSSNQPDQGL